MTVTARGESAKRAGIVATAVGGAAAAYLFDPEMGRTRRAKLRDKMAKAVNRTSTTLDRTRRHRAAQIKGLKARAAGAGEPTPPADDRALVDRIKSDVIGPGDYPRDTIMIDAVDGVVTLRGQVRRQEQISSLEDEIRRLQGVVNVENLLHLPGRDAPNKSDALDASRQ